MMRQVKEMVVTMKNSFRSMKNVIRIMIMAP